MPTPPPQPPTYNETLQGLQDGEFENWPSERQRQGLQTQAPQEDTPTHWLAETGQLGRLNTFKIPQKALTELYLSPNKTGTTPFHLGVWTGQIKEIPNRLKTYKNLLTPNKHRYTALNRHPRHYLFGGFERILEFPKNASETSPLIIQIRPPHILKTQSKSPQPTIVHIYTPELKALFSRSQPPWSLELLGCHQTLEKTPIFVATRQTPKEFYGDLEGHIPIQTLKELLTSPALPKNIQDILQRHLENQKKLLKTIQILKEKQKKEENWEPNP